MCKRKERRGGEGGGVYVKGGEKGAGGVRRGRGRGGRGGGRGRSLCK